MKTQLGLEKTASSVLLWAAFSYFTTGLASAQAETTINVKTLRPNAVANLTSPTKLDASSINNQDTITVPVWTGTKTTPVNQQPSLNNLNAAVPAQKTKEKLTIGQNQAVVAENNQGITINLAQSNLDNSNPGETDNGMEQVTSVSQLRDVQPTDWAFQALQSLVERYGCIAGYPDGTYRGNRAMTRYEFAAGLNACMDKVNQLIQASSNRLKKEDLVTLQRLQEEFAAELGTVRGRVDTLEARTAELEANRFAPTTKLFGQAIFGIQTRGSNKADFFPVDRRKDTEDTATNVNFINNVSLSLFTQFSPRSLLLTGIQMGNGNTGPRLSNDSRLAYEGDTQNQLVLSDLNYRQLIGNRFAVIVGPVGVSPVNVFRGANRVESAGQGPISALAQRNPIINIGSGRGGIGFDWQIANRLSMQAVYAASTPENTQNGLFGGKQGETSAGLQFNFAPADNFDIALHYINAYSPFGRLGTALGDDQLTIANPLKTNAVGATVEWRITPSITIGGWGGYTTSYIPGRSGSVETTNWMAFANFPNLFGPGNLGGIYVGQPPKITSSDLPLGANIPSLLAGSDGSKGGQPSTTTHVEAFYRVRITDNITITPGVLVIFNPGHNSASDTITIGALRTTFSF